MGKKKTRILTPSFSPTVTGAVTMQATPKQARGIPVDWRCQTPLSAMAQAEPSGAQNGFG